MRTSSVLAVAALVLVPAFARAQGTADHMHHDDAPAAAPTAPARDPNLPADETTAKDALDHSPRHGEYFDVPMAGGTPLRTWVVYPERKDKAPVVLIIHEIFGLSDWIRALADQAARDGFIAVAPDLISGLGPNGGGTESMASRDSVVAAIRRLTPEMAWARLDVVRTWSLALPSANGSLGTVGFCWGGGRSFDYAIAQPGVDAAVVYYGVSPDSASLLKLKAPVLGLYGGDDARVNATIEPAKQVLGPLKKSYEVHIFDGAGHGFLRQQTARDGANLKATQQAWPRTVAFLKANLKPKKK
jgi:carboxymethylenebutenolidase